MAAFDDLLMPPTPYEPAQSSVPATAPAPSAGGAFDDLLSPQSTSEQAKARGFNEPFGELKPSPPPSWSDWIAQKGQDALMAMGAQPYPAGHIARGVRDIVMASPAGAPIAAADVGHYAGQGEYGQAALNAASLIPAVPLARAATGAGVSSASRLPLNFADTAAGEVSRASPSSQQLLERGAQGFTDYRNAPVVYSPNSIDQFTNDVRNTLNRAGQYDIPGSAPVTHDAINRLQAKAQTNPLITPQDLDELRMALSGASKKGESGAMQARSMLYDHLDKTGNNAMQEAVQNYAAGKRGEIVDTILRKSANASDPERALTNQLRSTVEKTTQRPRGFTSEEIGALDAARVGSPAVRALEGTANIVGGEGIAGRVTRAGVAGGLGLLTGPLGAGAALAPEVVSGALRMGAGGLRREAAASAGDLVRQRSPMFLEAQAASNADPLFRPGTPAQSFVMRNAIAQALLNQQRGQ